MKQSAVWLLCLVGLAIVAAAAAAAVDESDFDSAFETDDEYGSETSDIDTMDEEDDFSADDDDDEIGDDDSDEFLSAIQSALSRIADVGDRFAYVYHYAKRKMTSAEHRVRIVAGHVVHGITHSVSSEVHNLSHKMVATMLSGLRWTTSRAVSIYARFASVVGKIKAFSRRAYKEALKWKRIIAAAIRDDAPNLFIKGASGALGPGTGGVERVYDFSTNEIGNFYYAGVDMGLNSGSIGVGAGEGIGWKGNTIKQSLRKAYSGYFGTVSADVSLPFKFLSAGASVSVSLDKNKRRVPGACKCVAVHGGLGVGLNPLPGSADVIVTNYWWKSGTGQLSSSSLSSKIIREYWSDPLMMSVLLTLKWANSK